MGLLPEHLQIDSERISQKLETFIKTSVGDFNREGVIIGLSGGIDSSLVLALSVAALDSSKVLGLIMPEKDSNQDNESDARLLAETLGVRVEKIQLTPILAEMGIYQHIPRTVFAIDFWNDAPYMGGCIAGARHYFHINDHGDVEP